MVKLRNFIQSLLKPLNDAYILERLEKLEFEQKQLNTEVNVFKMDVLDQLLPQIDKINRRNLQRLKRENEKETVEVKESVTPAQPDTYGFPKIFGGGKKWE